MSIAALDEALELAPAQSAVLVACAAHARQGFSPITPKAWWRAGAPFRGEQVAFVV